MKERVVQQADVQGVAGRENPLQGSIAAWRSTLLLYNTALLLGAGVFPAADLGVTIYGSGYKLFPTCSAGSSEAGGNIPRVLCNVWRSRGLPGEFPSLSKAEGEHQSQYSASSAFQM
ncbi:hypothetical protein KUCAC02_029829, partial [Chaenocephalus aceratus]